jgi:sigma-B regulation protein RsbU (phosphoserine phosphatase)
VVLFTDGITEAFSREDGIYGEERFWATVRAYSNASAQDMLAAIDESVAAFVGDDPPSDDVTLMVLHRLAS